MTTEMVSARSTPVVFIVDDDAAVRSALCLLVQSCGWTPVACACGGDCLAALASAWPACIVIDPKLPDIDGSRLQREMSRLSMNLPVIVITDYEDQAATQSALVGGAKAVIAKPFRGKELMSAIAALVSRPRQGPPSAASIRHAYT
jgi:FixJ family two-component response regulator